VEKKRLPPASSSWNRAVARFFVLTTERRPVVEQADDLDD
jgi:hypothetical protein